MKKSKKLYLILTLFIIFFNKSYSKESTWFNSNSHHVNQPINGMDDNAQDQFIIGRSFFTVPWVAAPSATTARDGLGPLFNANTCVSCHNHSGPGEIYNKEGNLSRAVVTKVNLGNAANGRPLPLPNYGVQIAINGMLDVPFEARASRRLTEQVIHYPDGNKITLKKPQILLEQLNYGPLPNNTTIIQRRAPALIGLGLLAQVKDQDILAAADKEDRNADGISGRPNWIITENGTKRLGRFTAKASAATLFEQVADAAANDMGLTNPLFPNEQCTAEQKACQQAPKGRPSINGETLDLTAQRLIAITRFISQTRVPVKSKLTRDEKKGKQLFKQVGCTKCHLPTMKTASGIEFSPYTDLLLHDMGQGLSDGKVEFSASESEFRTAPLWGLTLGEKTLPSKRPHYLHDGRAETIEEAILWHAGEAQTSKYAYMNLTAEERKKLLKFLRSL